MLLSGGYKRWGFVKQKIMTEYIIRNDNPSLIFDHSRSLLIKTNRVSIEKRRLDYLFYHVDRCKKPKDVIKLILMVAAIYVFISALIVSITQEAKLLKETIYPQLRTGETKLLNH